MQIVFFCNRLNHHQAPIADELYALTEGEYRFMETQPQNAQSAKGCMADYSDRPYLVKAWLGGKQQAEAEMLAEEANVAFLGAESFYYEVERMSLEHPGLAF